MDYLNDDNFVIYAAHFYNNRTCATKKEFDDDLNRIKFIIKMFKRYEKDRVINERLVLNHLILLYNVFERDACTKMLVYKMEPYMSYLKPFLVFLNFWPERLTYTDGTTLLNGTDIVMDDEIIRKLRAI